MIVNDPCAFCIHLYDDSDPSVGLYGTGCDSEVAEDWVQGQGTPCPGFQPQLASDGLLEQLADEYEYEVWKELNQMKEELE